MGEMRWTPQQAGDTRDGVDAATLDLTTSQAAAMGLVGRPDVAAEIRAVHGGAAIKEPTRDRVLAASAIGLLKLPGNQARDWLQAGRAVQRVWLAATRLGVAFQLRDQLAVRHSPDLNGAHQSRRHQTLA